MGLFRAFLRPGEPAEPCEPGDLIGDEVFVVGIVIGLTKAEGLTEMACCEPWSMDKR